MIDDQVLLAKLVPHADRAGEIGERGLGVVDRQVAVPVQDRLAVLAHRIGELAQQADHGGALDLVELPLKDWGGTSRRIGLDIVQLEMIQLEIHGIPFSAPTLSGGQCLTDYGKNPALNRFARSFLPLTVERIGRPKISSTDLMIEP